MGRNYYTFGELVFGLRKDYLKNRELLKELNRFIHVDGYKNDELKLSLAATGSWRENHIKINFEKKQSDIANYLEYIKYLLFSRFIEPKHYQVACKDGERYYFGVDAIFKLLKYGPGERVYITNPLAFKEVADEILNSRTMQLKSHYTNVNPFEKIYIGLDEILIDGLSYYNKFDLFGHLKYNAITDTFFAWSKQRESCELMKDFLNTPIPIDFIPEEYQKIIDENLKEYESLLPDKIMIDSSIKGREELEIDEREDKILLHKKRKVKIYEQW